jgi:hypothetical protein
VNRPNESLAVEKVSEWHERAAPLPEYEGIGGWSTAGGVLGTLVTLLVVWLIARGLRVRANRGEDGKMPAADGRAPHGLDAGI